MQPSDTPAIVHAVIVTFHPTEGLRGLVDALLAQVDHIHVCDNTPASGQRILTETVDPRVTVHAFGRNLGVAAALNHGIAKAHDQCTHVLLSDQDSLPLPGMVQQLLATCREHCDRGVEVAVVGPDFVNDVDEAALRFQAVRQGRSWLYPHLRPTTTMPVIEVAAVITSGSLIPTLAFDRGGPFHEGMFIDYVDIEWCERVRSKNMVCLADGRAKMRHAMGDASLRYWLLHWRVISSYSPLRLYYQVRNAIFLARQPYVTRAYRSGAMLFVLRKVYVYAFFLDRRLASLRSMVQGVIDGMSGRLGPRA